MTATVAGIHLGIDTHANRPAGNAVPDGSLYSCSTHSLVYKSNLAGNSWATWATLGGVALSSATPLVESGAGAAGSGTAASKDDHVHPAASGGLLQSAIAARTAGDLTTTSATLVDVTGLTVTLTTGAHRCLVIFSGVAKNNNNNNTIFTVTIDGTAKGGSLGLSFMSPGAAVAGLASQVGFSYLTDVLSAASHTIKMQWMTDGGSTGTLFASSGVTPAILTVIETGLTT